MPSKIRFPGRKPTSRGDQVEAKRERDAFYSGKQWRELRRSFLRENPLCVECRAAGRVVPALIPHHKVDRLEAPELAYDERNLEALCSPCHTSKHNGQLPWRRS